MARPARELTVTHRFTVELTDHLELPGTSELMTRDEAREVLNQALYQSDKHAAFSLNVVDEEDHDG
ncbi:hypothetical protein ACFWH1_18290 [Streptomyces sp. NPDC127037]|uniref:hypothetical protein n=1 Tax=Streptomyces sp. NPDC127037 TaxID=3347113 RepID=UPI00365288ED